MEKKKEIQEAHIYFPIDLYTEIKMRAKEERRTFNGQVLLLLENQLQAMDALETEVAQYAERDKEYREGRL